MRQAARIAVNRTVAGVHFPVDTAAGQVLGLSLARYFILRAKGGPRFDAWRFDGGRYGATQDFDFHDFYNPANGQEKLSPLIDPPYVDFLASTPPVVSPILKWLWDAAFAEVSVAAGKWR